MIRILFVDDSLDRVRTLISYLNENKIEINYEHVSTKEDALRKMAQNQYDMVLIDIMLPTSLSTIEISKLAGVELIKSINYDRGIIKPLYVIGITSNEETYNKAKDAFDKELIPLNLWTFDDNWKKQFISKIQYLIKLSNTFKPINSNKVDVAIVTAVDDEYNALNQLPIDWVDIEIKNDPGIYSLGSFLDENGQAHKILKTKLPEMGMSAASYVTTKVINVFEPDSLLMVGICGGRAGKVNLGDIIVAERTWDYGSGKIELDDSGKLHLLAEPHQCTLNPILKGNIERNSNLVRDIYEKWNEKNNDRKISEIKIGAVASGSAVIATKDIADDVIATQYRKFLGIDMETYGVYFACQNSGRDLNYISIKAVSDLADQDKDDTYHNYCSYASAMFAYKLLTKNLL